MSEVSWVVLLTVIGAVVGLLGLALVYIEIGRNRSAKEHFARDWHHARQSFHPIRDKVNAVIDLLIRTDYPRPLRSWGLALVVTSVVMGAILSALDLLLAFVAGPRRAAAQTWGRRLGRAGPRIGGAEAGGYVSEGLISYPVCVLTVGCEM